MKLGEFVTLDSEISKWFGEGHWWSFSLTLFELLLFDLAGKFGRVMIFYID